MRIATYNIWDSDSGMPMRFQHLIDEIKNVDADIMCLQEVSDRKKHDDISEQCGYKYSNWKEQEGISILSKHPIEKSTEVNYGLASLIHVSDWAILAVNVHLPWDRPSLREQAIVKIVEYISTIKADYVILLGDFNCSEKSAVHRFLTNQQSLLGEDAYYFDLAEAYTEINGTRLLATLNFRDNPRWGIVESKNTIELNQRFDRILLKNPYPEKLPELKNCDIFGTKISELTNLAASDHYGLFAEMDF